MRFLFVVHGWYLGGFATFCRNLAVGLRQRHQSVALLVLPEGNQPGEVSPGVFDDWVVVPRGVGRLSAYVERVVQTIEGLRPEVVVLNDSPYGMAALPFIGQSILRIPVIHSGEPDEGELGLSQEPWWDQVLVVSDYVAQAVKRQRKDPRISVCPLGVPLPEGKRRRGDGRDPLEVISVGRVEVHQKRMDRIPAIARLLRGIPYYWTVVGEGAYLPQLCQEINRAGLAKRFRFAGGVGPSAVTEALQKAEVLIMPSDCEGMPQALLEAMAQGVVPVVSRLPGATTALVEEGKTGYLCAPAKAEEFARAVAELAGDRGRCAALGNRAAALVAQHFSLEAFVERFLAAVAEVRGRAAQRPAPLPRSRRLLGQPAVRCLGFWRSLRYQSLGRCKRWWLGRMAHSRWQGCRRSRWASKDAGAPGGPARSWSGL